MSDPSPASTRDRIIAAADELFYQRGFAPTSFADIAERVQLSRGNFYYHFKTKDEILAAVIVRRRAKTQAMLDAWAADAPDATGRLRRFAEMLIRNQDAIQRYGCPVGTLCTELAKLGHPGQAQAGTIFGQFRDWLREQFEQLGHRLEADALAMHLLARSQGIATLAHAFRDEAFIGQEVENIERWLQSLQAEHPPR